MTRIKLDPIFRIHQKNPSGSEIFIHVLRMNSKGPIHYFADHTHARNFCRYLFSRTGAHPANHLTARNVVTEHGPPGTPAPRTLDAPEHLFVDFMARRFPRHGADRSLCDDGAYVVFAILTAGGHLVSNVVSPQGDGAAIDAGHMFQLRAGDAEVRIVEDMVVRARSLTDFEGERTPSEASIRADRIVQKLVSERMGLEPVLTVSHRDQLDHNQCYHIHRLIRRVEPEDVEMAMP
jgi:hypothetical protein